MREALSPSSSGSTVVKDRVGKIEQYGVEYIPEDERGSKPKNLFTILFGGSLTFSLIIIGWFPIAFGLSFWAAASAVVVGSAAGACLLAPMGLMGPRSGTNNPVSSGAFFGIAGRLIGSFLEATASLAFAALSIWTGGDALAGALQAFFDIEDSNVPRLIAYAILSVIVTIVSVLGHANMVAAQRFMIPTAGACLLIGLVVYGRDFDPGYGGAGEYVFGSFFATWLTSAVICGSTVASYGAYAGDWTRHISPKLYGDRTVLKAMFLGGLFGMGGPFMWGTFTSAAIFNSGVADGDTPYVLGLVEAAPLWYIPALIYLGLASGTAQAVINTYGTGLDTSSIIPRLSRVQATVVACVLASALVYFGHFNAAIIDGVAVFLTVLASFSIPWIIMVAIGHVSRRGYYDVDALQVFTRGERGGVYWFNHGFNVPTMAVWVLSTATGLLFASNVWFVGPGAAAFGDLDLGFLFAGITAAVLYPLSLKLFPDRPAVLAPVPDLGGVPVQSRSESHVVGADEVVTATHAEFRSGQRHVALPGLGPLEVDMAYTDVGDGDPVVLLHGIPTWSFLYADVIPALADHCRVLAVDMLGHGWSDRRDRFDRSLRAQASAVLCLLDALNIERATFVGHDTGGGVALILGIEHPDRVARLVLTNTVAYDSWPIDDMIALGNPAWRDKPPEEVAAFVAGGLADGIAHAERLTPTFVQGIVAPWSDTEGALSLIRNASALNTNHTMELVDRHGSISAPSLVLWGVHDPWQPLSDGHRLVQEIPGARLVEVDASHWIPHDAPEEFVAAIVGFLRDTPLDCPAVDVP